MPTRLWDVRSALLSLFANIDVEAVFDGPMSRTTPPRSFLLVGTDGGETGAGDGLDDGAVVEQSAFPTMDDDLSEEHGEVTCAAWAWSGDTDFAPLRAVVQRIVEAAELQVATDRSLAGALVPPGVAVFGGLRLRETQTSNGAVVRAAFTVSYDADIENT